MSKLDKEQVLERFSAAYEAANGKAPEIEAAGGWYSVDGGKKVRLAQLDQLANEMSGGTSQEAAAPAEEAAPAKASEKPAEKPAAAPKKAAKKEAFSVKAFWIEHLDAEKPGSIAPR